ncbi:MAG TPA: protein tyrosine phosphatase-like domain-containing protein [Chitinophagales bacterium]|nr:protein tyrosine phosphatase-like domain-containing protein [Chitinophagales bacterium]
MNNTVRTYLAAYNAIAFLFWAGFLVCYLASSLQMSATSLMLLNIAQGMALLEILHALLKWVKSPVGSTIAQVASRIMVLVFINLFIYKYADVTVFRLGVLTVSFAWTITELIRYSFYFFALFGRQFNTLLWMRYSFFILLYPIGVTGEWLILITPLAANGITLSIYTGFLAVTLVAYVYYFPVLYGYMFKQRKVKVTGK